MVNIPINERIICPDCNGQGKIIGVVEGVPASVCTKYTVCNRCWPRDADGNKKFWNDGTAGTISTNERETNELAN